MVYPDETAKLQQLAAGRVVLEMGSLRGVTTRAMSETAACVHAIDWFHGDDHHGREDTLADYLANCRDIPNIATHIGRFENVCPYLAKGAFELVFLDGYHTYEQVKSDIELLEPLLAFRSVVAFHDYTVEAFGVRQAVDEVFKVAEVVNSLAVVGLP